MSAPGPGGKVVLVAGPTASGKSRLAEHLAIELGGEIVSADALQVYRRLDVGTAKPSSAVRARIPHHCVDIFAPDERCTAGEYARRARTAIADIHGRGRTAILAGGSGFYVKATVDGLDRLPRTDPRWRACLLDVSRRQGPEELARWLRALDPARAARIGGADEQRLVRALEVVLRTGLPLERQPGPAAPPLTVTIAVGLDWPRQELYERIRRRVDLMIERGWLAEVRGLLASGIGPGAPALQAIGYRELVDVATGARSLQEARARIVTATRRYAKRQIGWFRRDPRIRWFGVSEEQPDLEPERVRARIAEAVAVRLRAHAATVP